MAGVLLNRLDVFGGAARLVYNTALTPQPTSMESVISKTGTLDASWDDFGATDEGASITWETEGEEWEVDQVLFPIRSILTKATCTIQTNLAELSLENFQKAWDLTTITAITSNTSRIAQHSLPLGMPSDAQSTEMQIAFIVDRPVVTAGTYPRVYCFYIVARGNESSEHKFEKSGKALVPITMKCRPDTTKAAEAQIGIIFDPDSATN